MKIGDTLYITILREQNEKENYRCKLVDMDQDRLYIDYPIHEKTNKSFYLPKDLQFTITYKKDQNVFTFNSYVIERKLASIPTLAIHLPDREEHRRIQRRRHVRINASVDLAVHCLEDSFTPFTTTTRDISGGGMSIYIKEKLFSKEIPLKLAIVLQVDEGKYKYIFTKAKFIRYKELKQGALTASLQFIDLKEQDQQKIISFCFAKEREQRKQEAFLENK